MKRGAPNGFADKIGDVTAVMVAVAASGGSTNAIEPSNERSESWQQDIVHAIIPGMS